jgi:glycosyltransferase involved in cell wall biosynthesis
MEFIIKIKIMFNPKVSIIIPVYNWSNYLSEAIESALAQTYKNIEILVINDWSNDNWASEKIALSFGDKINYIYKENGWVATALNLWIEKASWEYISWLSHDDLYYPNKTEEQVKVLEKLEDKNAVIYWNIDIINEKWKIINYSVIKLKHINNSNFLFNLITNHLINWCTLLIPKQLFNKIWWFDNDLKTVQDYDMWFRMYKNNVKFLKIDKSLIQSRYHSLQDSRNSEKFILMMKEEHRVYWNFIKNIWLKSIFISYNWGIFWFIKNFIFKIYFKINIILPVFIFIWKFSIGRKFISKIRWNL